MSSSPPLRYCRGLWKWLKILNKSSNSNKVNFTVSFFSCSENLHNYHLLVFTILFSSHFESVGNVFVASFHCWIIGTLSVSLLAFVMKLFDNGVKINFCFCWKCCHFCVAFRVKVLHHEDATSPSGPHLWIICRAGCYMLRWGPSGSLWPFVTWPHGFLQLVKQSRSVSLHLTVLSNGGGAALINDLTVQTANNKPFLIPHWMICD